MSSVQSPVSDLLLTVKSREIQRGMAASAGGDHQGARRHFLAAAHLELVLADDYQKASEAERARRSRVSAASCFWRAGEVDEAQELFDELMQADIHRSGEIQEVIDDLKNLPT